MTVLILRELKSILSADCLEQVKQVMHKCCRKEHTPAQKEEGIQRVISVAGKHNWDRAVTAVRNRLALESPSRLLEAQNDYLRGTVTQKQQVAAVEGPAADTTVHQPAVPPQAAGQSTASCAKCGLPFELPAQRFCQGCGTQRHTEALPPNTSTLPQRAVSADAGQREEVQRQLGDGTLDVWLSSLSDLSEESHVIAAMLCHEAVFNLKSLKELETCANLRTVCPAIKGFDAFRMMKHLAEAPTTAEGSTAEGSAEGSAAGGSADGSAAEESVAEKSADDAVKEQNTTR